MPTSVFYPKIEKQYLATEGDKPRFYQRDAWVTEQSPHESHEKVTSVKNFAPPPRLHFAHTFKTQAKFVQPLQELTFYPKAQNYTVMRDPEIPIKAQSVTRNFFQKPDTHLHHHIITEMLSGRPQTRNQSCL